MIIKPRVYKEKMVRQRVMVSDDVHGCDECKKEIKEYPNERSRLEVTVHFNNNENTEHLHFCSWGCVVKHLKKIKTDYFASLPFLYFDGSKKTGRHATDLLKLLKHIP